MNAKNEKTALKTLVTGLIWSGLTLGSLATVGCDQIAAAGAAKLSPSAQVSAVHDLDAVHAAKPESRSGIRVNHNETFLTAEDVA